MRVVDDNGRPLPNAKVTATTTTEASGWGYPPTRRDIAAPPAMTDARGEACVGDPITIATEERDHAEATCRRRVVMCSVPRLLGGIRLEATIDATQDKPDAKPSIARGEVILPARPKTNDSPIDIRATGPTQLSLTVPTRCDPASIVVSLQDHDRGARLVDVTPKGEGRFTAQIARAGRYQISVVTCDAEGFRDVEVGTKPVDVVMKLSPDAPHAGRPSALRELFANEATTCARATDESLWCWGDTLGYRGGEDVSWSLYAGVPTKMSLPVADGKQVAFGRGFACVVKTDGTVWCFEHRTKAPLEANIPPPAEPSEVSGLTQIQQISLGRFRSCALRANGRVLCWAPSVAPPRRPGQKHDPVMVTGLEDARDVQVGNGHACALKRDGRVACWGHSGFGELGRPSTDKDLDEDSRATVVMGLPRAEAVAVGSGQSCARTTDGSVYCWGLRFGANQSDPKPRRVEGISDASALTLGHSFGCALSKKGTVSCWGSNANGALGNGPGPARDRAEPIASQGESAIGLVTGAEHACVLTTTGEVRCWGANKLNQLGDGLGGGSMRSETAKDHPVSPRWPSP